MTTLGNCLEVLSGYAFDSANFGDTNGAPLVRIRDVVRGYTATFYSGEFDQKYLISDGDLLVGMDGEFNRGTWSGGPALLNQRVCKLIPDSSVLDGRYLYHFLPRALKQIEDATPFATVKHLSAKTIREIDLALPPLPEQRRIASILDQVDALRTKRCRALVLLEKLVSGRVTEITSREDWPVVSLGEVANTQGGLTVNRKRAQLAEEAPYLRVANVSRGAMNLTEVKTIGVTTKEIERVALKNGDLLIVEGHGNENEVGRAARWTGNGVMLHQNHLIRVRADGGVLNPTFAEAFINGVEGRSYFWSVSKTTSGLNTINMSNVKRLPLRLPPIEVQRGFASQVGRITVLQQEHRAHLTHLDELFASLQSRAFKGKL